MRSIIFSQNKNNYWMMNLFKYQITFIYLYLLQLINKHEKLFFQHH